MGGVDAESTKVNVKNMLQEGTRSLMFKQQLTVCLMLDVYFDVNAASLYYTI